MPLKSGLWVVTVCHCKYSSI